MMNRRNFVKTTSVATTAAAFFPTLVFASGNDKKIGIQLYSLRQQIGNDFLGTLQKVSEAGYKLVEAAGYNERKFYGYSPAEYRKIVMDLGMLPMSTHNGINIENAGEIIEDCKSAGMEYLVLPSIPAEKRQTIENYKSIAEDFNKIGEQCKAAGLKFGYHNHAFEFEQISGQTPYDVLLLNTDPELVFFQIDFYWVRYGGRDAMEFFEKYPGRFALWHIKDMKDTLTKKNVEVGSGFINFKEAFKISKKAGMEYVFVEQEEYDMEPFMSIRKSFDYLNSIDF